MCNHPKYVVMKYDFELPYVCPYVVTHKEFVSRLSGTVVSAGFYRITKDGKFECYGKSVSLGVKSRLGIDSKLLTELLT